MNRFLYTALIVVSNGSALAASPVPAKNEAPGFFETVYEDHFKPSLLDGFDGVGAGIILGGISGVFIARPHDTEVRRNYKDNQKMSRDLSRFGAVWGSGGPGIIIAASQLALDPSNGMAHAEALAFTSLTHVGLVLMSQRGRPYDGDVKTSFPSGHSASAWATATSLSYAYGWPIAIPSYTAALLTMGARISDDRHWLSDTIAGATLGLFWGRATSLHPHLQSWNLSPFWSMNSYGVSLRHEF